MEKLDGRKIGPEAMEQIRIRSVKQVQLCKVLLGPTGWVFMCLHRPPWPGFATQRLFTATTISRRQLG